MNTQKLVCRLLASLVFATCTVTAFAGAYDDLVAASYRGDNEAVIDLIIRGMDANTVDPAGNTLLHIAARSGNEKLVAALLKQKANPNARNPAGDSPLMLAAYAGEMPAADALLAGGAQINLTGWNALHYAVFASQPEMVAYLLGKGANVDARAPNEQTALMLAAKNGNLEIVKMLINAKADSSLKDQQGETALSLAQSHNNTAIAALIENPESAKAPTSAPVKPVAKPVAKARPAAIAAPAVAPAVAQPVGDGEYVSPPFQTERPAK